MAAKDYLTRQQDINVTVREQDFVTVFNKNWDALRKILGIMRPIRKTPGTRLASIVASVNLESGAIGEGEEIPYSRATITEVGYEDITVEKFAKAVSVEAVNKYGAEVAVARTDEEFMNELQNNVLTRFYTYLNTGALTGTAATWQAALAKAKGLVLDKFQKMRRTVTNVVGFANILDLYDYLGAADITVQTAFGLSYIQNFMGYGTLFLLSEPDIARGDVIAVPVENIDLYYIDPGDSDIAKLGLNYTVQGETNLIGIHVNGNYSTAVGEMFALMGMTLFSEYLDGIAIISVGTESFTAVQSPTGNPAAKKYYEKDGSVYFRTTDTTVASGKTYYTRTVTSGA